MTQNFVKVSQEHKHIVVKNAGGLRGVAGPQGIQGIPGPAGERGPAGIQGERGPAGEAGPAGIQGERGPAGERGETGATGPQGPAGPAGAGLVITGSVDTYAELPNNLGPSDAGKAYFVQADGKLYVWSGTSWPAEGEGAQFEGPQGPTGATGATGQTGPAGADGYSPTATVAKSGDTATITITDKNGTTTAQVSDGTDGAPGADGFSPIATVSKSGTTTTISITDEQGTTTATVNDGVIPTIDSALSTSSENPVQNKVITAKLNDAAFVGTEVVGGTSLIDTSDIAPSAITTTKIADGAVTSNKIDSTTLYNSDSGTQTNFSLSDSPANYAYVDVYFAKQNYTSGKLCSRFSGDSTRWYLLAVNPGTGTDNTLYFNSSILDISGTNVTYTVGREGYFSSATPTVGTDTKPLKIFKVIGYK